jgi:hypothetical protein
MGAGARAWWLSMPNKERWSANAARLLRPGLHVRKERVPPKTDEAASNAIIAPSQSRGRAAPAAFSWPSLPSCAGFHAVAAPSRIQFNEKGQNDKLKNGAIQNRAGKFATIAPKAQSDAKPELPMTPYDKRG